MNKQELIEIIENQPYEKGILIDTVKFNRNWLLRMIDQLDEPQKPVIPQFVANMIEGAKEENPDSELGDTLQYVLINGTKDFAEWFSKKSNRDLFARACILGYEVEKEKRYRVRMKGANPRYKHLKKGTNGDWLFGDVFASGDQHYTRKELEEGGFGWVFDCPGIEIEEVE